METIMNRMYTLYLRDKGLDFSLAHTPLTLSGYIFIDGANLTCKDCGVSYQQETRRKIDIFTVGFFTGIFSEFGLCFVN